MADTAPQAEEASNNPADVTSVNEQVASKDDVQPETNESSEAAKTEHVESESKPPTDEKPAEKPAERGEESENKAANDENDKRHNGRADHRNGGKDDKNDRGNKRFNDRYNDRYPHKKSSNRLNEFANLPETDDPDEIREQVEFYFSSQNLATDWHMFKANEGPKNRPVSIKHLCSFKRMVRFQPYSAVVAALRESNQLVVVDDGSFSGHGNEGVKRKEPLDVPEYKQDEHRKPSLSELHERMKGRSRNSLDCSVYVKGFGDEKAADQISLERWFKPYGAVMMRKRRDEDDKWKGSVFVEFDTEESQQQFLALDPKPKYNGNELIIMSKRGYSEMKCKEKGITPKWEQDPGASEGTQHRRNDHRDRGGHRGGDRRGGGRGRGGRGGRGNRYNDRSSRRDDRGRGRDRSSSRSQSRSRSPYEGRRRRDRSYSRGSGDSKDWNGRRDKFQKSREFKNERRGKKDSKPHDPSNPWGILKDEDGVPIVQDTSEKKSPSNKRKADSPGRGDTSKKSKVEIKEDA